MKKNVKLIDLDCAHCAAKIENAVRKLDGVNQAEVNFMSQNMMLDAEDDRFDIVAAEVVKLIHKIEPDVTVRI
ncbi:cation transporter [Anaerolentibacter hominis]|uniref:cation transporter n=1 Tax=Anaerolentibacter hominis TaxID=3079009 RepID=UPI0031B80DA5